MAAVFSSPRLFAGRGRVRGLGDWPQLFNQPQTLQITMSSHGWSCGFNGPANLTKSHFLALSYCGIMALERGIMLLTRESCVDSLFEHRTTDSRFRRRYVSGRSSSNRICG